MHLFLISKVIQFYESDHSLAISVFSLKSKPTLKILSRCLSKSQLKIIDFSSIEKIEFSNLAWIGFKKNNNRLLR